MTHPTIVGCGDGLDVRRRRAPHALRAQATLPIRVGATPNDTYAEAYYALDGGFFAKAGLSAEVTTLVNGAGVSAAVASGALDVGVSGPVQTAQAFARGIPFTIIAAGALSTAKSSAALLCVPKASPIQSAKDLAGMAIAVNALRTTGDLSLHMWLAKNGIDAATVHVVEVPMSEMGVGGRRPGRIGAAVISEPSLSIALRAEQSARAQRRLGRDGGAVSRSRGGSHRRRSCKPAPRRRDGLSARCMRRRAGPTRIRTTRPLSWPKSRRWMSRRFVPGCARRIPSLPVADVQPQLDLAAKFGYLVKPVMADGDRYSVIAIEVVVRLRSR